MQSCQAVIKNESEILSVGMSKPPKVPSNPAGGLRGAVSAPAGYGAAPRSKKYVSNMKKKYYLRGRVSVRVCRNAWVSREMRDTW